MGKWLARLAALDDEKVPHPPYPATDKTDKRGVLSVLAVGREGSAEEISAAPGGGAELSAMRSVPAAPVPDPAAPVSRDRPYLLSRADADHCHDHPWDDAACARFVARVSRFLRLGIDATDADDLAERLHLRDVQHDDRSMCVECTHYRPGRCGNHRRAGLSVGDVGRDLAAMLQRCLGFDSTEAIP